MPVPTVVTYRVLAGLSPAAVLPSAPPGSDRPWLLRAVALRDVDKDSGCQAFSSAVLVAGLLFRCELPRVPTSAKLQAKSQRLEAILEYLG